MAVNYGFYAGSDTSLPVGGDSLGFVNETGNTPSSWLSSSASLTLLTSNYVNSPDEHIYNYYYPDDDHWTSDFGLYSEISKTASGTKSNFYNNNSQLYLYTGELATVSVSGTGSTKYGRSYNKE